MTAVYLRGEDWAEGAPLGDVPLLEIDSVIPTIRRWGIMDSDADLYGQFVYIGDEGVAYYEVVIPDLDSA